MRTINEIETSLRENQASRGGYEIIKLADGPGTAPLGTILCLNYQNGTVVNADGFLRNSAVWALIGLREQAQAHGWPDPRQQNLAPAAPHLNYQIRISAEQLSDASQAYQQFTGEDLVTATSVMSQWFEWSPEASRDTYDNDNEEDDSEDEEDADDSYDDEDEDEDENDI